MRFGVFQLLRGVEMLALIPLVFLERRQRPRLNALKPVVLGVEFYEVDGQFAPDDELLKECFTVRARRAGILNRQRDRMGTDMAKVKIRRKLAGAVPVGVIALGCLPW